MRTLTTPSIVTSASVVVVFAPSIVTSASVVVVFVPSAAESENSAGAWPKGYTGIDPIEVPASLNHSTSGSHGSLAAAYSISNNCC